MMTYEVTISEEDLCGCGHERILHNSRLKFCRMNGCECDHFTLDSPEQKGCGKDTEYYHGLTDKIYWKCGELDERGKPFLCSECSPKTTEVNK